MLQSKGFTLIESVIGIALMLIIFLGIFGVYQLGFKVISNSRARITAIALSNQKLELARNLSYNDVGTIGGIPSGVIPETEIISRNNIKYTVKTTVIYIDDLFDGMAPVDSLPNDYKKVKVKTSWQSPFSGEIVLITDVAPKGLETSVGGGNLLITIFNAFGISVPQADIHVVNNSINPPVDVYYQTNDEGQYLVAGAPASVASYEIIVSKAGYSVDRTYGTVEVANPETPHATVIEGSLTQISFSIDMVADFLVDTVSPYGTDSFFDSFLNTTKISEISNITVYSGEAALATSDSGYQSSGFLISNSVSPVNLASWDNFFWNDTEPVDTDLKYQVFYAISTDWFLVPNNDLPGNSTGFDSSSVDLSGLSPSVYYSLKVKGNFSTASASITPVLYDWSLSWLTNESTPIPNTPFHLRGAKLIGTDADEMPVHKYSVNHVSNSVGHLDISNLEWDGYTFSVDSQATGLNLTDTNPSPQPINLLPNANQPATLFLAAQNSLLAKIKDGDTGDNIFSASVRISNISFGYDEVQFTDNDGETIFIPLENGVYGYEIQVAGYENAAGTVSVNGDTTKIIYLTPGDI